MAQVACGANPRLGCCSVDRAMCISSACERNDIHLLRSSPRAHHPAAVSCPVAHEPTALLEQVAAPVSSLHLVADDMRERHFNDVIRIVGGLCSPVSERA